MTKDEILAEAKIRYPIGSRVRSLNNSREFRATIIGFDDPFKGSWDEKNDRIWFGGDDYNIIIYEKGKWAERLDVLLEMNYSIY